MQKRDSKICKILIIVFLLCARLSDFSQLSAHSGLLSGERNLRVAKTQWFDIIYPARCEQSAAILYEKADALYEEVTAQYGLSPSFRMPVVITPAVQQFNAFWTSTPYNHIAIYDTGDSGASELAVFSETLLSTFRHELTHAVTYNMKNGFWRALGKIFGDCVAPGMLSVTTGMAEGATLTSESAAGEGRLNDEYAKHYVKQAKIEGVFPSYHDVSGSADIQPGGAPYFFNGAFHQWLQDEYGMQPYAEFWYRVVNGKNLTISGAFKKAFGIKLKAAWKLFEASYEVPDLEPNPVKAGLVKDFFEPEKDDFSTLNDAGSLYASLTAGGGRLAWLDQYGSRLFMAEERGAWDKEKTEFRQLFALRGIDTVRLSNDGRFVAASYITENAPAPLARVKIYDISNKRFYSVKATGLKEAVVVQKGSGWYLAAQKYFNQHYYIDIYELVMNEDNSRITDTRLINEIKFDPEINPYAFTPLNNGCFAWLKKDRLRYSLCISDAEGTLLSEYAFPEGMAVRSLSYRENEEGEEFFFFSYAQKGTLPRPGVFDVGRGQLLLGDSDISGGVFEPVYWNEKIVYVGGFLRQNRLLFIEESDLDIQLADLQMAEETEVPATEAEKGESAIAKGNTGASKSIPSKDYNALPYHLRGILVPLSLYESDYFGCNEGFSSDYNKAYIGATYITANPWTNGDADLITLTGGWNTLANSFGTSLTINKGTATSLFKSQTELKSEFDKKGWKQGGGKLTLSTTFRTGNISRLSLSNQASALFGKQDKRLVPTKDDKSFYSTVDFLEPSKIGITSPEKDTIYCGLSDVITAAFSTVRRSGPGRFENKGVTFSLSYGMWYDAAISEPFEELVNTNSVAAAAGLRIPHILPFESKYGFTYNFPLSFTAKLLPSNSVYGYASLKKPTEGDSASGTSEKDTRKYLGRPVFDTIIETTVFSMDIQKAVPGITALYLDDFYFACGYAATGTAGTASKGGFQTSKLPDYFSAVADGRGYFLDSVYFKAALEFTPNIGLLASPAYKMSVSYLVSYTLHSTAKLKPNERLNASLGFDLNF